MNCFSPSEYVKLATGPTAWLLEPLIPKGGSAVLWGASKSGKSVLGLQMVQALSKGEDFLSFPNARRGKTLYLQIDIPRSLWITRQKHLADNGVHFDDHFYKIADKESAPFPFSILQEDHYKALRVLVDAEKPDLVIVDTLRESFRGDENDSDRLQQVMASFTLACRPAAILYIHHGKKEGGKGDERSLVDQGRGSSYVPGAVDTILSLKAFKPFVNKDTGELIKKGQLSLTGRAVAEQDVALVQDQTTYLWHLAPSKAADPIVTAVLEIMEDLSFDSDVQRSEVLHQQFPQKTASALRMMISRRRKDQSEGV
jgi:RecA-family ATPase